MLRYKKAGKAHTLFSVINTHPQERLFAEIGADAALQGILLIADCTPFSIRVLDAVNIPVRILILQSEFLNERSTDLLPIDRPTMAATVRMVVAAEASPVVLL